MKTKKLKITIELDSGHRRFKGNVLGLDALNEAEKEGFIFTLYSLIDKIIHEYSLTKISVKTVQEKQGMEIA